MTAVLLLQRVACVPKVFEVTLKKNPYQAIKVVQERLFVFGMMRSSGRLLGHISCPEVLALFIA